MRLCIALDVMGGDFGPSVVIPAALQVIDAHPHLELILVGDEKVISSYLPNLHPRLKIHHASQQVAMDESPVNALRNKKDSSLRVALNLVKAGEAQACVSAGNTGALMATAKFVLKTIPGVDRPALVTNIPTISGRPMRVLDLGANVDSKPQNLVQFAVMGSILAKVMDNIAQPTVALLNIGHEDIKGNELVKLTAGLLRESRVINYVGYIEADEVFKGEVDVVVCDGFVGNVALKASEGTTRLAAHYLKQAFYQNWITKFIGLCAMPVLKSIKKRIDPARYNGASLLGLQGIVVKSHGGANVLGFVHAIEEAILQVNKDVIHLISDQVTRDIT
jgi:glycerol-3-phosphate acyltransferase PlsX